MKRFPAKNASATRAHVIEALEPRQLLSAGGFLDPTFQQGGFKILSGLNDSVVTLPDGKILVEGNSPFVLKRLNPDGTPDPTFGHQGIRQPAALAQLGGGTLIIQPDGKILAGSFMHTSTGTLIALARFNADGTRDTSFGTAGLVTLDPLGKTEGTIAQALLLPDGKILLGAISGDNTSPANAALLIQLQSNGALDPTFGSGGVVTVPIANVVGGPTVAVDSAGRIYSGITAGTSSGTPTAFNVVRYLADGTLDTSFGASGIATAPDSTVDAFSNALNVRPDGTAVAVLTGGSQNSGFSTNIAEFDSSGNFLRLTPSEGPTTLTGFQGSSALFFPDGHILVGGGQRPIGTGNEFAGLAMFNADESLDTTFGNHGLSPVVPLKNSFQGFDSLFLTPSGSVMALSEGVLARYLIQSVTLEPNGALLLAGGSTADNLAVSASNGTISATVNGSTTTEPAASVTGIHMIGGPGDDTITAGDGVGNVTILAGTGNDSITGGDGNDSILGAAGNDTILGGGGNDIIRGQAGDDSLVGGDGNDTLDAGTGSNTLLGGLGDDLLNLFGGTADSVDGGAGTNTAFRPAADNVRNVQADHTLPTSGAGGTTFLDLRWGNSGFVQTTFNEAIGFQPDGQLIVAGTTAAGDYALARLNLDGSVDTTFANHGLLDTGVSASLPFITSLVQPDGKLLFFRGTQISRYTADAALDTSFGMKGTAIAPLYAVESADRNFSGASMDPTTGTIAMTGFVLIPGLGNGVFTVPVRSSYISSVSASGVPLGIQLGLTSAGPLSAAPSHGPPLNTLDPVGPNDQFLYDGTNLVRFRRFAGALSSGGTLLIGGTTGDDTISVTSDGATITLNANGVIQTAPVSIVKSVLANAGSGDDVVTIGAGVPSATVLGGAGNDTLIGGNASDLLAGGAGEDSLVGGSANDTLRGGGGNDTVIGGAGTDSLFGGIGDDTFFAIDGQADTLDGGAGTNTAHVDAVDILSNIQDTLST